MTYTPPAADNISISLSSSYTAPDNQNVDFELADIAALGSVLDADAAAVIKTDATAIIQTTQ